MEDGVEFPVNPIEAFESREQENLASQVTLFLLIGALSGTGRSSVRRDSEMTREEFPVPDVKGGLSLDPRPYLERFRGRFDLPVPIEQPRFDEEGFGAAARRREIAADLVSRLYRGGDQDTVAYLILLGLGDTNEFIRAAAAISYLDLFSEISLGVRHLINIASDHSDELAGVMAETALQRLGIFGQPTPPSAPSSPPPALSQTATLIVHGSHFAFVGGQIGNWWRPNGDFHTFIKTDFRPNLYSKPDCYVWSGGWSDHARKLAAIELRDWARNRNFSNIDVLAHSHGGNVVMWATQLGLELNKLVLLSCPAHELSYQPEYSRVKEVISYQIKLDWVILADGGGTYFSDSRIDNQVQNRWFRRHSDTHDPAFWNRYGLTI